MTLLNGRAPRSAVMSSARSRSFVAILCDDSAASARFTRGRVAQNRSCTPERLRS